MDNQQRLLGFQKEYKELSDKWGVDFVAIAEGKQLGPVIQIEPKLNLIFKEEWQNPNQKQSESVSQQTNKPQVKPYQKRRK